MSLTVHAHLRLSEKIVEVACHHIRVIPGGGHSYFPINALQIEQKSFPIIISHTAKFGLKLLPFDLELGIKSSDSQDHVMICHAKFYDARI